MIKAEKKGSRSKMSSPINYMQNFTLAASEKRMITMPSGDNARISIHGNTYIGIALSEADAVNTSGRFVSYATKLNDHPIIIDPPLLMNGESLWIFEVTGSTTANVSIWVTGG